MTDREKFEAWIQEWWEQTKGNLRFENGSYTNNFVNYAWEGYQAALASQQLVDDGWVEWKGDIDDLPPVGGSVVVEVKWSDGSVDSGEARQWRWSHEDESENVIPNVIAYRVVKP